MSKPEVVEEWMGQPQRLMILACLAPAVEAAPDVVHVVAGEEAVLEALDVVLPQPGAVVCGLMVGVGGQTAGRQEDQEKRRKPLQHRADIKLRIS